MQNMQEICRGYAKKYAEDMQNKYANRPPGINMQSAHWGLVTLLIYSVNTSRDFSRIRFKLNGRHYGPVDGRPGVPGQPARGPGPVTLARAAAAAARLRRGRRHRRRRRPGRAGPDVRFDLQPRALPP